MKYYAFEGGIGTELREGCIEITENQYQEAINTFDKIVTVRNGIFELIAPEMAEIILDGEKQSCMKHLIPAGAVLYDNPENWYMENGKYVFADEAYKVSRQKQAEKQEIITMLEDLDAKGERASREIALAIARNATPPAVAVNKLQSIETQAEQLRARFSELT